MRKEIPIKTVRSTNKYELIYLVRKYEKQGWTRGKIVKEPVWNGAEWRCYMSWQVEMETAK